MQTLQDMQRTNVEADEEYKKLETAVNELKAKWEAERVAQEEKRKAEMEARRTQRTNTAEPA